jgi:hypothetical protein
MFILVTVQGFKVQRFRGSRFHFRSRTAFGTCIYKKNAIFDRPNPKFGAKFAVTLGNDHVQRRLWVFNAFFALNPER